MGNMLYIIALVLIVSWAIGFFAFGIGAIIHVLFVFAVIALLLRIIQGDRV